MNCKSCQKKFIPNKNDLLPNNNCPDCRVRLLLSFRNERYLHKRNCDLCKKELIGVYRKDAPFTVYCSDCWWSDKWEGLDYGFEYHEDLDFIEQFKKLFFNIPHLGMSVTNSVNCDFTNYSDKNKDCFLLINALANENVYYSERMFYSKDCVDCNGMTNCQLCYWCTSCRDCYNCKGSEFCEGCTDCDYCYDCKSCQNCFGSFGLRNKKYVYFNKQLEKEEYNKKIKKINYNKIKKQVYKHWLKYPHRYTNLKICEKTTGDNVSRSQNCKYIFDADEMENCKHCYVGIRAKDSQYCVPADEAQKCFNNMSMWQSYNVNCSIGCWYSNDILYSYNCMFCSNCLGCASLNKKKFCILNKQYSEAEYKKLSRKIINQLKQENFFGEFFPVEFCMYPYNESIAYEHVKLTKQEALNLGYRWTEQEEKKVDPNLPICKACNQNYKVIKQEKELYKKMNLEEPVDCPKCRYQQRFSRRNPRRLYERKCEKCNRELMSSYSQDRPENIYCEDCYNKEIY